MSNNPHDRHGFTSSAPVLEDSEWLTHFQNAIQLGHDSIRAGQVADVLAYGSVQPKTAQAARLTGTVIVNAPDVQAGQFGAN